jgi:hypothetical protein
MIQERLNAIACENCRSKKCKCDRKLFVLSIPTTHTIPAKDLASPICSQCQSSSLPCQYQEGGKRGLPATYITALEKRLAETETALYASLIALQELNGKQLLDCNLPSTSTPTRPRSKAEKLEDWKRLPLQNSEQLNAWLQAQQQFSVPSTRVTSVSGPGRTKRRIERSVPPAGEQHVHSTPADASVSIVAVMQQLKSCSPAVIVNSSQESLRSGRWQANYF